MAAEAKPSVNEYRLDTDSELRIEVGKEEVIMELLEGTAEIFGTPLSLHKRYNLPPGYRAAIYTYQGAQLEIVGKTESAYIAQQTPMIVYANDHAALEAKRKETEDKIAKGAATERGPRIMITGPNDVGKKTLCRILCNYAVKQGRTPLFVDLDVSQGLIDLPGTVSAAFIEKPADIIDGFDLNCVLTYHYGHLTPYANMPHFETVLNALAETINKKSALSKAAQVSGCIINTTGWVKGEGYDCIVKAAEIFEPTVVVVLDHERLYNDLQTDLPNFVKILHQPKSGGVEGRSADLRSVARQRAIHQYFYGTRVYAYFPHTFEVSYDKTQDENSLTVAKVGAEQLPDSCLPVGMEISDHRTMVVSVPIDQSVTNHLLALMPPDSPIDHTLITKTVQGFVVVTKVDTEKRMLTLLSPQPHPLPTRVALLSDLTFLDQAEV